MVYFPSPPIFSKSPPLRTASIMGNITIIHLEQMPCQKLRELYCDPDHGDRGARLHNLNNWKAGNYVYEKLGNSAQEKAKNLNEGEGFNEEV